MLISRIIHQTARDFASLPGELKRNIEQLKALNPGWEYRLYDNADQLDYIGKHLGGDVLRLCERIEPHFQVMLSDVLRYAAIHREGGVYLDIKSTATRPLDEVLLPDDVYLLSQWRNRVGEQYQGWGIHNDISRVPGGEFQNWHIIAAAGHPFLEYVIEDMLRNMRRYHPLSYGKGKGAVVRISGPIQYTQTIAMLMPHYRARVVDIESLGFRYTIYADGNDHMQVPGHYSKVHAPIMQVERDPKVPEIFIRQL